MKYTEQDIATLTAKRLKLPSSQIPMLMTLVPSALNNLAKNVATDPMRRNLLMTTTTVTTAASTLSDYITADLATSIETYGILLDYIRYGTLWSYKSTSFTSANVSTSPTNSIDLTDAGIFSLGQPVYFTTSGTLPTGLTANTTYYAIPDASDYQFASSYANAVAGTEISLTGAGSGSSAVISSPQIVQWLNSPNQGSLNEGIPIAYPTVYLRGTTLYCNNITVNSTIRMLVPYVPNMMNFPTDGNLDQDLIDAMVELYLSADPAEEQKANA